MTSDFRVRARDVLRQRVFRTLEAASDAAASVDVRIFAVGGVVRDVLLGEPTEDVDLMIEGEGGALVERLAQSLDAAIEAESAFGTWRLMLPDGERLDLATARTEVYPSPGALPEVAPGSLGEDLARRDFSINALAVRLGERWSAPLDLHHGRQDLERGLLRTLHPESFEDDPTRILRGIELGTRFRFEFATETADQARQALAGGGLARLSPERLRTAWRRAFGRLIERGEDELLHGLGIADDLGLLAALSARVDSRLLAVPARLTRGTEAAADPSRLLFRSLGGDDEGAQRSLAGLWSSRPQAADEWASFSARLSALRAQRLDDLERPSQVAAALDGLDAEALQLLFLLADEQLERILTVYREQVATTHLTISGRDLLAQGYESGQHIGRALAATRQARMDGLISPAEELEYACASLRSEDS